MPPLAQPLPKEAAEEPIGINAVLLGPPGSGKGTQVGYVKSFECNVRYANDERIDFVVSYIFRHHCLRINFVCVICQREICYVRRYPQALLWVERLNQKWMQVPYIKEIQVTVCQMCPK
jgi:Tfp pilus assembly ATPase PilU